MFFALLIAAVAPVTADPDADTDEVRRFEIRISERAVQRESNSVRVTRGEYVEMLWQSDEAVKLHLHGYDIEFEITPEKPAAVTFEAHATGRFPITSHGFSGEHGHGHEALLYLEVYPD
jgi:hypothetical protein